MPESVTVFHCSLFNSFVLNSPFLYPLKTRFSDVFREWRKGALGTNKLMFSVNFHNKVQKVFFVWTVLQQNTTD